MDRPFLGQGQECSRLRTQTASDLKKKSKEHFFLIFQAISKKKSSKNFVKRFPKKGLQKNFLGDLQNLNNSKNNAVLEPRTEQFLRT